MGSCTSMFNAHQGLGEILFAIYLVVLVIVYVMGRQGRVVPSWLTGIAHGLLGLQVLMGIILIAQSKYRNDVPWYHPLLGILAALSLGLTPVMRQRFGRVNG